LEDLTYPITAFYYDKRTSLLFLGLSNSSFQGKINNYFSKIFSGSSSKNTENTPGFLVIYNIIKNNSGAHHFEPLYERPLTSEVSCINFYPSNNILSLGLNSGTINLYKVFINESSKVSKELVEEVCVIKAHKKRVLGVCFNFSLGYVYSVAKEGSLVISEMNYGSSMKSIPISKKEINSMTYDENWGRLFLTDTSGSIWILDLTTNAV
jgi:WD40 repeat protein